MIWYLLYPFRGTTEAPVLSPAHPLHAAFTRYGRYVARHVVSILLISVAVAAVLIYPIFFLYTNDYTNGASNLPHHVWTDAHPLQGKASVQPDVFMRSIWVHGSYMQALEKDVLLGALELQNELLGTTEHFNPRLGADVIERPDPMAASLTPLQRDSFHIVNGLTNQSWFFHSPLQYWSGVAQNVQDDRDIVTTVNERKTQATSVNVTLRHSIVFAGKRFEDRRLVAADALVITLIHLRDSPIARIWQQQAAAITKRLATKWHVYPGSEAGQLYEFQFRPMSLQDTVMLGITHVIVLIYFLVSLSKLRAVKSRIGLMVTVIAQIVLAIVSSFTVCAVFKIDLSRIPRMAYPVVVFSISLENIFRLINAVIMTPSEDSTSARIGHAFGETSHVALASVIQNLLILWGLSQIVSPGVSAFCTFAAIALIFDFFYLSTFFLAVLSVDVRRTELSDALAKASIQTRRQSVDAQPRQNWFDALLQGKIAMSTRIAGTVVMIGFVLIAQWHFFENESILQTLGRISRFSSKYQDSVLSKSSLHVDIHQARSPTSWLRLQDHETAREVIHVVKPHAHSYIAKVYEPLVFVLKGSDRMPSIKERPFPPAVYDFARHQSSPFVATVLLLTAAVRLLMNYLLFDELAENGTDVKEYDRLLHVRTLDRGHVLDVALLTASTDGLIVSMGLDRAIRVWDVKEGGTSYPLLLENNDTAGLPFQVLSMCIDDESHWLALLTPTRVLLWNLVDKTWALPLDLDDCRHKPEAFFFCTTETDGIPPLLLIRRDGSLTILVGEQAISGRFMLTEDSTLASVATLVDDNVLYLMMSTRKGHLYSARKSGSQWVSQRINLPPGNEQELLSITPLSDATAFFVARSRSADLVHAKTNVAIHSFKLDPVYPKSLKSYFPRARRTACGARGLTSLTVAYIHAYTRDLVVHTYLPPRDGDLLCIKATQPSAESQCCNWDLVRESRKLVKDPGIWDLLPSGLLAGVRRQAPTKPCPGQHSYRGGADGLRRRRGSLHQPPGHPPVQDKWEVWALSYLGRQELAETASLCSDDEDDSRLFVTNLGPVARVGSQSIAIGLGTAIKVISVGQERFQQNDVSTFGDGMVSVNGRRRRAAVGGVAGSRTRTTIAAEALFRSA
ncbi:sterol-sensing domain of SREBP cleavage-activation-domain-containing protein [Microdochium trichocladiopsis]|uniref:Sterol regulatory element-binding protein cleavage-activating protein n=1 Tax=Microdochium trichocladiopsis TaxID=1682393 RepID=A0A9P8Y9G5_9PEZI|nr:sterol-sensing domain of SREBP cleavage-activation-domain-containing protein [Microdochium trichocladiopsis]KAH7033230.1 sterol-sensing domain of SREBP cleavage-activation-domain-containing protein [Microdochium trichocladiopsis]